MFTERHGIADTAVKAVTLPRAYRLWIGVEKGPR